MAARKQKQSLLQKVLTASEEQDWEKEELLDVLHWWKQIVAIACGVTCGLIPILHVYGLLTFIALLVVSTIIFYRSFLKIDQEGYGGHGELLAEGMPFAFGMFALSWILVYSMTQQ